MNELQGRVRYIRDGRSLISGRTYNELATLLRNLSSETIQIGIGPNGGLKLEVGSFGASGGGGGGGGGVAAYAGPFALSVYGASIYVSSGRVIHGVSFDDVAPSTVAATAGYVYLTVESNGDPWSSLSYSVAIDADLYTAADQDGTHYRVVLGEVVADGATYAVRQWQHGDIYIAGRVV